MSLLKIIRIHLSILYGQYVPQNNDDFFSFTNIAIVMPSFSHISSCDFCVCAHAHISLIDKHQYIDALILNY